MGIDHTKDTISVDIVIPSIRHDPKKLLSMLNITIPSDVKLCWYVVSDNPSSESSDFTYGGSPVHVIVNTENLGAPLSRNVGLESGSGDYVFFLDDDVIPAPDILSRYVDVIRSYPDAAGYIGPTFFPDPINSFTRGIRASDFLTFFEISTTMRTWVPWGTTSNLLVPRKNVGSTRFSKIFPKHGGGEDIDFCLNVVNNTQKQFKIVPDAYVRHGWWGGGRRSYRRFFRWAFGDSNIVKIHPETKFRDFPNMFEMLLFGSGVFACLLALEIASVHHVAVSVGIIVACELAGEQTRKRITRGKFSAGDAIESAIIRLSNEMGRIVGNICHKNLAGFFVRFDYFGTGESVPFERKISGLKFISSIFLISTWFVVSHILNI
ncbi:MAG: glycosyltransferase [Nitrosopumilus sp. D6]|nr:MAG: glycosyltransferase [Nitrosopumilus sp. D6]